MFCPDCGTEVAGEALTCSRCGRLLPFGQNRKEDDSSRLNFDGAPRESARGGGPAPQTALSGNVAALACYVLGWVTGIILLLVDRDDRFIRFHAWQSILAFGGITVIHILLNILAGLLAFGLWPLFFLFGALHTVVWLGAFILWLILMVKAYRGERYQLPWVGELARRYAGG